MEARKKLGEVPLGKLIKTGGGNGGILRSLPGPTQWSGILRQKATSDSLLPKPLQLRVKLTNIHSYNHGDHGEEKGEDVLCFFSLFTNHLSIFCRKKFLSWMASSMN